MQTGVYGIFNLVNGKVYIGSSEYNFKSRWNRHRSELRKHIARKHLQAAWNKYGEKNFNFRVLDRCPPDEYLVKEQQWIDLYLAYDRDLGYNTSPTAGSNKGLHPSKNTKAKTSAAMKGVKKSEEHCRHISEGRKGKVVILEEQRKKIAKGVRKHWNSLDTASKKLAVQAMLDSNLGEGNCNAVLTEEDVRYIRSLPYRHGLFTRLAKQFNVHRCTIARAYSQQVWQHVDGQGRS